MPATIRRYVGLFRIATSIECSDQLSKVDDAFLESAQTNQNGTPVGGLGNSPVVDKNGKFLRYEILISPASYDFVVQNRYYDNAVLQSLTRSVTFPCGEVDYRGGQSFEQTFGRALDQECLDGTSGGGKWAIRPEVRKTP